MWPLLVFLLSLLRPTLASPIPLPGDPSTSACLALLVVVSLVLAVLTILKHVYMRHRRISGRMPPPSPADSIKFDSSYNTSRSSASFLQSFSHKVNISGFWVGFFGSPRWETRFDTEKSISYRRHFYHLRGQPKLSSRPRCSSAISKGSAVSIGDASLPVSTIVESRALYSIRDGTSRSRSLRLPSYPAKVHVKSSQTPRRFSAPADSRSAPPSIVSLNKKRHSSLRPSRSHRSDICAIDFANASLRLVDSTIHAEPPLPLSPKTKHSSPRMAATTSALVNLASCFPPSSKDRKYSGLPELGPCQSPNSISGLPLLQISHPFALSPGTKDHKRLARTPPNAGVPLQPQTLKRCPPSPQISSGSPPASGLPGVPGFSKHPPKLRAVTPRARRSPVIGPSPLRVMTLPDPSGNSEGDTEIGSFSRLDSTRPLSLSNIDDDETALMGIIQELIEETSEWDPSLFMEPSFKSLLEDSGVRNVMDDSTVGVCLNDLGNTSNGASSGSESSTNTSNHSGSEEMDLSLLDIDFTQARRTPACPEQTESGLPFERSRNSFVSFWDDVGWEDSESTYHSAESVGLAV